MLIQEVLNSALQDAQAARFRQAEKKLRRLLAEPLKQRDLGTIQGLLGVVYASAGDRDAAIRELTAAAGKKPDDATIHSNLCNCLKQAGRINQAIAAGRKAVALRADFAEAHNNLGNALAAGGDVDGALESYRRAVTINPVFAEAQNNLGVTLFARDDWDGAIAACRTALRIRPDFADAQAGLAEALNSKGDLDSALESYRELLLAHPQDAGFQLNMGIILERKHDLDGAIVLYRGVLDGHPQFTDAHICLGNALKARGDMDDAAASYRRALQIDPGNVEAHENLGAIFTHRKAYDEALRSHDAADSSMSRAEALLCLYALGRYDEFDRRIAENFDRDRKDIRIAAVCDFVAGQTGRPNRHPFCPAPLDFVSPRHIADHIEDAVSFLDELSEDLRSIPTVWEPLARTTRQGYQTNGNLFRQNKPSIARLEQIIEAEIAAYRSRVGAAGCLFTEAWPANPSMTGWSVRLQRGGHQSPHIHSSGWLSGVIYVDLVDSPDPDEGAIVFGQHVDSYPFINADYPRLLHRPQRGEIVLFPSSLYHHTIPIRRDGERLTVSFDLRPG